MSAPPTFVRSTASAVLLLLREHIASAAGLPLSFVVVTAADDPPHHRGNKDVLLELGREDPDREVIDGGGRVVYLVRRDVEVVTRIRRSTDRSDQDLDRLTHETLGLLPFQDTVIAACAAWLAEDDFQNAHALPLPLGACSKPQRDREDMSWISSSFPITFAYLRSMDSSTPDKE